MSITRALVCVLCLSVVSCGGDPSIPVAPTGPPATLADFSGNWAGTFTSTPSVSTCFGVTWTATQDGTTATGPAFFRPIDNREFQQNGTMTATQSGSGWQMELNFPAGSFSPQSFACTMTGSGIVQATTSGISGTLTLNWGPSCVGNVWRSPQPQTSFPGGLALTKNGTVPSACP